MIITDITSESCSALTIINGQNHRKAYMNNAEGRIEFAAECSDAENYAEAMTAWGNTPTVVPEPMPEYEPDPNPSLEERVSTCETDIDQIVTGLEALANG